MSTWASVTTVASTPSSSTMEMETPLVVADEDATTASEKVGSLHSKILEMKTKIEQLERILSEEASGGSEKVVLIKDLKSTLSSLSSDVGAKESHHTMNDDHSVKASNPSEIFFKNHKPESLTSTRKDIRQIIFRSRESALSREDVKHLTESLAKLPFRERVIPIRITERTYFEGELKKYGSLALTGYDKKRFELFQEATKTQKWGVRIGMLDVRDGEVVNFTFCANDKPLATSSHVDGLLVSLGDWKAMDGSNNSLANNEYNNGQASLGSSSSDTNKVHVLIFYETDYLLEILTDAGRFSDVLSLPANLGQSGGSISGDGNHISDERVCYCVVRFLKWKYKTGDVRHLKFPCPKMRSFWNFCFTLKLNSGRPFDSPPPSFDNNALETMAEEIISNEDFNKVFQYFLHTLNSNQESTIQASRRQLKKCEEAVDTYISVHCPSEQALACKEIFNARSDLIYIYQNGIDENVKSTIGPPLLTSGRQAARDLLCLLESQMPLFDLVELNKKTAMDVFFSSANETLLRRLSRWASKESNVKNLKQICETLPDIKHLLLAQEKERKDTTPAALEIAVDMMSCFYNKWVMKYNSGLPSNMIKFMISTASKAQLEKIWKSTKRLLVLPENSSTVDTLFAAVRTVTSSSPSEPSAASTGLVWFFRKLSLVNAHKFLNKLKETLECIEKYGQELYYLNLLTQLTRESIFDFFRDAHDPNLIQRFFDTIENLPTIKDLYLDVVSVLPRLKDLRKLGNKSKHCGLKLLKGLLNVLRKKETLLVKIEIDGQSCCMRSARIGLQFALQNDIDNELRGKLEAFLRSAEQRGSIRVTFGGKSRAIKLAKALNDHKSNTFCAQFAAGTGTFSNATIKIHKQNMLKYWVTAQEENVRDNKEKNKTKEEREDSTRQIKELEGQMKEQKRKSGDVTDSRDQANANQKQKKICMNYR